MGRYDKHSGRVGRAQGATTLFIGDDGYFDLGDVKGGANGAQFAGRKIQLNMLSKTVQTFITFSTNSTLAVSQISPAYGYINLSGGLSTNSCALPTASAGAFLVLNFKGIQSDLQVKASGVSLIGQRGSDLNRLSITNGSVNSVIVELTCFTDGCWAVTYTSQTSVEVPT